MNSSESHNTMHLAEILNQTNDNVIVAILTSIFNSGAHYSAMVERHLEVSSHYAHCRVQSASSRLCVETYGGDLKIPTGHFDL